MLRNIIAILAGIIAGLISIALIEYLGQELFPTPANLVLDEELYNNDKAYEMIPLPAMLMVLLAYLIGSFVAGFTSASIGQRKSLALVSGFVLLLGGLINILLIPTHCGLSSSAWPCLFPSRFWWLYGRKLFIKINNLKIFLYLFPLQITFR